MRVLGWHCFAASRFSIVLANVLCPLRSTSDSHVPGVHCYQVGRSFGLGESLGSVWDTRAAARRGWRLNSQGGRNREGGGKVGLEEGVGGRRE